MKRIFFIFIGFSLLSFGSSCGDQVETLKGAKSVRQKLDSLFTHLHAQDRFHGGAVISKNGEIVYETYRGIANRSWDTPVHSEVLFDIASVNKSITAALVLKAVEEERFTLETKLVVLLKNFEYAQAFNEAITIHHLLCHTSGLPDYEAVQPNFKANNYQKFKRLRFDNKEYVEFISRLEPLSEPGTAFYYSNFGYHLLAILLEETYQLSFEELLRQKFSEPLGLEHTQAAINNEQIIPNLATGYNFNDSLGIWQQNQFIDLSLGRRVFSTPRDLNRWALALENPGYLSAESLTLMKSNHLKGISKTNSYGYGWVVGQNLKPGQMGYLAVAEPYIIHGGATEGYKAMLLNIDEGAYVISFLSNVGDRTHEMELVRAIVKILNS